MRRDPSNSGGMPMPRGRTNEQYVADQIKAFRERYGSLPGFDYAEAYLESILSLATTGDESPRVSEVRRSLLLQIFVVVLFSGVDNYVTYLLGIRFWNLRRVLQTSFVRAEKCRCHVGRNAGHRQV